MDAKYVARLLQDLQTICEDVARPGEVRTWKTKGGDTDYEKQKDGSWKQVASRPGKKAQEPAGKKPAPSAEPAGAASAKKSQEKPAAKAAEPVEPKVAAPGDELKPPVEKPPKRDPVLASRVGVAGDSVPPPGKIPRLPNLTAVEKAVEEDFAGDFEKNPDKFVDAFHAQCGKGGKWVFETDGAKNLSAEWERPDLPPAPTGKDENGKWRSIDPERGEARALYNTALHQTSNAICKKAFLKRLDEIATMPEDQRKVLVTSGGVAAGKGTALKADPKLEQSVSATWDAAGEQNSTENEWVLEEAAKRGISATFLFVHAPAEEKWPGVIERAKGIGRMVDARVFADSYGEGAKNFKEFHDKYKDKATFVFHSAGPPSAPLKDFPKEALVDSDEVYRKALAYSDANKDKLPPHIYEGATNGRRIWGNS